MVAQIIINSNVKNINKIFDYNVPTSLVGTICVGDRVLIPFGKKKELEEGFVIGFKETSDYELKDIQKIEDGINLTKENIELAILMAKRYFCNISDCIKLMLPPGTLSKVQDNRVKEKKLNFIYLKQDIEDIKEDIENNIIKSDKQLRVLNFLIDNDGISKSDLELYTDTSNAVIKALEKKEYIEIVEKEVERDPFSNKNIKKTTNLILNNEQQIAFDKVKAEIIKENFKEFLLYGVTGSGKTEVYLQLIGEVLKKDKTAIMLVPEISLTPQMVERFIARFGKEKIAVLHSKLSIGERYDQWRKIKSGECKIIIGARSAIFAPISNLGLIIIDEEHDSSYKSDMSPRYNAKELAKYICKINNAPLLLGSATPDISSFYMAEKGEIELLKLTNRANNSNLPDVEIIDLRKELINGNKSIISTRLYELIEENIKNKKQTILFLNRRGFSTFVMCRECGYTVKCKNCNITMTYHLKENKLKCHYCGYEQKNLTVCPECNSKNIKYFGSGTQKLETEINKLFPNASTIRMDVDTVSKKNSHEEILNKFKNENVDILIGTQMVVKGHHFPNVTLVGVIAADSSLQVEDYRAQERTFQILTQVAGRAGRENLPGKVIIQTYNPDDFSINCAKEQNYDKFYETEIYLRKQLNYPPFCDIINIVVSDVQEENVKNISYKIYKELLKNIEYNKINVKLYKPLPAPINKIKNKYRWRIVAKGKITNSLIQAINNSLENIKFKNTKYYVDTNPSNMS